MGRDFFAFGAGATVIAVGMVAMLSMPGDKKQVMVPVPGVLRLLIEITLAIVGSYATCLAFGQIYALAFGIVWLVYLLVARERRLWLMRGAKT